ncbi:hypothetical protein COV82_05905 [Candidatus Peregrinibacteria bacterium CG11_big_fil_rev_8_21_14_0_20_46_8]|nr:MAG: hypothetical protein COV82_05905 [Candidatus Peregrinibacteria bacterium CG11_big_fil_rev_8_21_14_0_20_46_8]
MKRLLRIIIIVGVIYAAYYFIFQNNEVVLNEASPLDTPGVEETNAAEEPGDKEKVMRPDEQALEKVMETMDEETKAGFMDMLKQHAEGEAVVKNEPSPMPAKTTESESAPKTETPAPTPEPAGPQVIASANFQRSVYDVEGKAILIQDGDSKILRFENFNTANGPLLKVYLSASKSAGDYIDLGKLKATKGNVNYTLPAGTDTDKYNHVLIWCEPFRVLFSFAILN